MGSIFGFIFLFSMCVIAYPAINYILNTKWGKQFIEDLLDRKI